MNQSHFGGRTVDRFRQAFTLIELLVVVAIIGVLGTLGGTVYSGATKKAAMTREIQAARTLVTAYNLYATENDGYYMRGYDPEAEELELPDGTVIGGEDIKRYPFRLAPYFGYKIDGVIAVNKSKSQYESVFGGDRAYGASLCPALGLNYTLVGGNFAVQGGAAVLSNPEQILMTQAEEAPLLLFASAGYHGPNGSKVDGYMRISPPYTTTAAKNTWGTLANKWTDDSPVADYGQIDARYGGKAVCAFLDGSVKPMSIKELADMRLWSKMAYQEDDPMYRYTASGGGRAR